MSKVQRRDTSLFSDVGNASVDNVAGSSLEELEVNSAIARQFIRLADDCLGLWQERGRDASISVDMADMTLGSSLESHSKEVFERNIAVVRGFIRLADECLGGRRRTLQENRQEEPSRKAETSRAVRVAKDHNVHTAAYNSEDVQ